MFSKVLNLVRLYGMWCTMLVHGPIGCSCVLVAVHRPLRSINLCGTTSERLRVYHWTVHDKPDSKPILPTASVDVGIVVMQVCTGEFVMHMRICISDVVLHPVMQSLH